MPEGWYSGWDAQAPTGELPVAADEAGAPVHIALVLGRGVVQIDHKRVGIAGVHERELDVTHEADRNQIMLVRTWHSCTSQRIGSHHITS